MPFDVTIWGWSWKKTNYMAVVDEEMWVVTSRGKWSVAVLLYF
jgi:hypothetical protein